jgi:hypothetical protein
LWEASGRVQPCPLRSSGLATGGPWYMNEFVGQTVYSSSEIQFPVDESSFAVEKAER